MNRPFADNIWISFIKKNKAHIIFIGAAIWTATPWTTTLSWWRALCASMILKSMLAEQMLLVGPPKPDRLKVRGQMKSSPIPIPSNPPALPCALGLGGSKAKGVNPTENPPTMGLMVKVFPVPLADENFGSNGKRAHEEFYSHWPADVSCRTDRTSLLALPPVAVLHDE